MPRIPTFCATVQPLIATLAGRESYPDIPRRSYFLLPCKIPIAFSRSGVSYLLLDDPKKSTWSPRLSKGAHTQKNTTGIHWTVMAPIATSDTPPNAPSMKGAEPTPLEAISHGPTLPGIPSFENLDEKRQWMYGVLQAIQHTD